VAIARQYSIFVARGDVSRSMTQHLERMPHAARRAKLFDAPLVRIFSFIRPGSTPDDHREEVLRRMRPGQGRRSGECDLAA
jgi:hypothetical protein